MQLFPLSKIMIGINGIDGPSLESTNIRNGIATCIAKLQLRIGSNWRTNTIPKRCFISYRVE
jgi:hypothetical protein